MESAVSRADASRLDALDPRGDELRIRLLDRLEEIRRDDELLASSAIVWPEPFAKGRISNAVFQVGLAGFLDELHLRRLDIGDRIREAVCEQLRDVGA